MPYKDKQKQRENNQKYRLEHKNELAEYQRNWWHKNKDRISERVKKNRNSWYSRQKQKCLNYYGGKCECCGETEPLFLCIDHINGNGNKHRKEITNEKIYAWLIRESFPDGFRLLCYNCNNGRERNGGLCPHKKEKIK